MNSSLFRQEWRLLRAERTLWILAALIAFLTGYGVYNGSSFVRSERRTLAATEQEQRERIAKLRNDLRRIEAGLAQPKGFLDPRSAASIGNVTAVPYVSLPPAPLAAFSLGQSDLYPYYYKVGLRSRSAITSADEIENPVNLLAGRFDLAFVIVFLFPLLILALTYNVLSAERENGTLALALSQPLSVASLIGRKIAFRALLLVTLVIVLAIGSAFWSGVDFSQPGLWLRLCLWMAAVACYSAFWFGLAVGVNALGYSSGTNALTLTTIWLVMVLLVPTTVNLLAATLYPVPSRVEMIQAMRDASTQASQKGSMILARYYEDHPDLVTATGASKKTDYASTTYAVQLEVDRVTQPVIAEFDAQVNRQQAFVDRFRFLSPAILTQAALNDISGTGIARYRHFLHLFDKFLSRWQSFFFARVFQQVLFKSADLATFPRFTYRDEPTETMILRVLVNLAGVLALTVVVSLWTARRLSRFSVAE